MCRLREVKFSGTHAGHTVVGRPADETADDAATVTVHAVERKEVLVVLTISGVHCKWAAAKASVHLQIQFPICASQWSRGHNHHRLQWKATNFQEGRELTFFVLETWCHRRWHHRQNRRRSHMLLWKSTRKVSFQRDREDDPRPTAGQVRDHHNTQLRVCSCDGRSCRHLLKCQQKRVTVGFSASSRSRDVLGDVVMGEVPIPLEELPPLPPPAEPSPVLQTTSETDAMSLAAIHPYGLRSHWK